MGFKFYADFCSKKYKEINYLFRTNTKIVSTSGEGKVIGLIYMLNPGSSRPVDDKITSDLNRYEAEYRNTETNKDRTMNSISRLLKYGSDIGKLNLTGKFTIHIENLFNICDNKNYYDSFKSFEELNAVNEISSLVNYTRESPDYKYKYVWLAWGNTSMFESKRKAIILKYPDAIMVKKRNHKGKIININYPHHPLYLSRELFSEFI